MDRILLGDNQFFGINHRSLEKANSEAAAFQDPSEILRVLCQANEIGLKSFMCTTHDKLEFVFGKIRKDPDFKDYKIIPCLPYAQKYAVASTDLGLVGALRKFVPDSLLKTGARGAKALLSGDYIEIMRLLVDAEMKMMRGLNIEAVFLQNTVTDLLLGLQMPDLLTAFYSHVQKLYSKVVGFITMNPVVAIDTLVDKLGLSDIVVCSPLNSRGFRMNPDQKSVEEKVGERKSKFVAMSIFASGAIRPEEAAAYVNRIEGVDSVLFGASTKAHMLSTIELLSAHNLHARATK